MSGVDRPYATAAAHYLRGRPPYSAELLAVMSAELGLDGSGTLVDVGCGPGVLAVQLAPAFGSVIGIDPEPAMLDEARRHAAAHGASATWIEARAEDLASLGLAPARVVTFGQSIHWTDRQPVLASVHELLEPGGVVALIAPAFEHSPGPADTPDPPIPHDQIDALIGRYLDWKKLPQVDTFETSLHGSPFGHANVTYAPGRRDIVRTIDEVVSNSLSMSYAAPDRFGDRLDDFLADLRAVLADATTTGRFHDWPGDTVFVWARKAR